MLRQFLIDLLQGEPIRVSEPQPVSPDDRAEAAGLLEEFEGEYRVAIPGTPPPLNTDAAVWSATAFYTASSLLIHRDLGEEVIHQALGIDQPDRRDAGAHYAVDLIMRFLPDLLKLAKSAATDDPLAQRLNQWATDWPLSSVGVAGIGPVDATPLHGSPSLMRLYTDRILATGDRSRLDDPAVKDAVRAALGDFPELCPSLAKELEDIFPAQP